MSLLERWAREGWLRPLDHALAQSLQRVCPAADERALLAVALASRAVAEGHSALPLERVAEFCAELAPEREPPPLPALEAWQAALAEGHALPVVLEDTRLYLRRYWRYEHGLALALRRRAQTPTHDDTDRGWRESRLTQLFPASLMDPHDAQAQAARQALHAPLLLLTGGPGTGKTATIARALVLRIEAALRAGRAPPRIALAAPTGKAATRLAEALREAAAQLQQQALLEEGVAAALPQSAATLHRLLGWRAHAPEFLHHAGHPLAADLVVIDEASMVDLPLMAKLVDAVPPQASLWLVGDPDQLPSVETGEVLAALCHPSSTALAPHRVALTRAWRQSEIDVPELASLVRAGEVDAVLDVLSTARLRGVQWRHGGERSLTAATLQHALPHYRHVQQAATPLEGLQRARAFRVLTAVREGAAGNRTLNAHLAQALQPVGARPTDHFHGALLIVTENSYRHGLFNGDIGLVWREGDALQVWFERSDGLHAWPPAALPAHELAFALTVHKSQGSEFDEVLLVLPGATGGQARALSREGLYTGLTRCRRQLTLWAEPDALRTAIARRAQRWSGLAQRLS